MQDPVSGRSTRRDLFLAVLVVGSLLLLIELGARLWLALSARPPAAVDVVTGAIETSWFGVLAQDLRGEGTDTDLYVPDAELFWTLRPGAEVAAKNAVYATRTRPVTWGLRINRDGFRGPLFPDAASGAAPVIATLGDSCTFGFRVDDADTYPVQLAEFLRGQGLPHAAVVNYGVPGYTSFQGRRLLERILASRRPDVVVLAFGANDLEADLRSDAAKAAQIHPVLLRIRRALGSLATARLFMRDPGERRTDPAGRAAVARVSAEEFRENLRAMIRAARASGARVILLDFVLIAPVFRDTLANLAREEGVPWLDARAILKRGLDEIRTGRRFQAERAERDRFWDEELVRYRLVYYDEPFYRKLFDDPDGRELLRYLMVEPVHPNGLGQRLIAEAVGRQIVAELRP